MSFLYDTTPMYLRNLAGKPGIYLYGTQFHHSSGKTFQKVVSGNYTVRLVLGTQMGTFCMGNVMLLKLVYKRQMTVTPDQ